MEVYFVVAFVCALTCVDFIVQLFIVLMFAYRNPEVRFPFVASFVCTYAVECIACIEVSYRAHVRLEVFFLIRSVYLCLNGRLPRHRRPSTSSCNLSIFLFGGGSVLLSDLIPVRSSEWSVMLRFLLCIIARSGLQCHFLVSVGVGGILPPARILCYSVLTVFLANV